MGFSFHGECDPGGTGFTAVERSGRSMSNPEHLPYDRERAAVCGKLLKLRDTDGFGKQFQ